METGSCRRDAGQPVDGLGRARMPSHDDLVLQSPTGLSRRTMMWGLLGLASCTSTAGMPPAPPAPAPRISRLSQPEPYRLQVGDILAVRLMLNPELNEEVTVRPDGRISTTVALDEVAYGRTIPELDHSLDRAYSKHLKDPRVSVVVKSFAPTRIYVGGEVA